MRHCASSGLASELAQHGSAMLQSPSIVRTFTGFATELFIVSRLSRSMIEPLNLPNGTNTIFSTTCRRTGHRIPSSAATMSGLAEGFCSLKRQKRCQDKLPAAKLARSLGTKLRFTWRHRAYRRTRRCARFFAYATVQTPLGLSLPCPVWTNTDADKLTPCPRGLVRSLPKRTRSLPLSATWGSP